MKFIRMLMRFMRAAEAVKGADSTLDWLRENKPAPGADLLIPADRVGALYKLLKPLIKLAAKIN